MTCERCEGYRWLYVSESWVDRVAPPDAEWELALVSARATAAQYHPTNTPPEVTAALQLAEHKVAAARYRTAAARESTYPCPVCNTEQFERWSAGHYHPTHEPTDCTECVANGWAHTTRSKK